MSTHIPKGIEVLAKKASVDPAFKMLLLGQRADVAREIGLDLDATEALMLAAVPSEQLEAIIARTNVPQEHRRAFLGQAAAAMLAAIGAMIAGEASVLAGGNSGGGVALGGALGDTPADRDAPKKNLLDDPEVIEQRTVALVAKRFNIPKDEVLPETSFADDLHATASQLINLRRQLGQQFKLYITSKDFEKVRTVGDAIEYVKDAVKHRPTSTPKPVRNTKRDQPPAPAEQQPEQHGLGGIRAR
jgi:acyl carrier protein